MSTKPAYPILPLDAICKCGDSDEWYLVEHGYSRFSRIEVTPPEGNEVASNLHGITDGWDDISEYGDGEVYFLCMSCDTRYARQPVDNWD